MTRDLHPSVVVGIYDDLIQVVGDATYPTFDERYGNQWCADKHQQLILDVLIEGLRDGWDQLPPMALAAHLTAAILQADVGLYR